MHISFENRVLGGWRGKSAGGTLGLPVEGRTERLFFTYYNPLPETAPPNDDLELQLVWLDKMENHQGPLTIDDIANAWRTHIHYMWDEYGRARWNLRRGVPSPLTGIFENPFASGMGSPIRSEIWAIVSAGNPDLAARFARLDAMIDHGAEGIAGEVFFTVIEALVLDGASLQDAISEALKRTDANTETHEALQQVIAMHNRRVEVWTARENLIASHSNDNFTHAPLNIALTLWALLYGAGDFEKTLLLCVNGGYDTDCTAASAGAILGFLYGAEQLPEKWITPLGDNVAVGPGIIGIRAPKTLQELTDRSLALHERGIEFTPISPKPTCSPSLSNLGGTSILESGNLLMPWANGELPAEVKATGTALWEWKPGIGIGTPHRIIGLAKNGMQLWIDGKEIIHCPQGVAYVPATHRAEGAALSTFTPSKPIHEVRIALSSANPWQQASVILSDASLHLAPWNGEILPFRAELPPDQAL